MQKIFVLLPIVFFIITQAQAGFGATGQRVISLEVSAILPEHPMMGRNLGSGSLAGNFKQLVQTNIEIRDNQSITVTSITAP